MYFYLGKGIPTTHPPPPPLGLYLAPTHPPTPWLICLLRGWVGGLGVSVSQEWGRELWVGEWVGGGAARPAQGERGRAAHSHGSLRH